MKLTSNMPLLLNKVFITDYSFRSLSENFLVPPPPFFHFSSQKGALESQTCVKTPDLSPLKDSKIFIFKYAFNSIFEPIESFKIQRFRKQPLTTIAIVLFGSKKWCYGFFGVRSGVFFKQEPKQRGLHKIFSTIYRLAKVEVDIFRYDYAWRRLVWPAENVVLQFYTLRKLISPRCINAYFKTNFYLKVHHEHLQASYCDRKHSQYREELLDMLKGALDIFNIGGAILLENEASLLRCYIYRALAKNCI